MIRNEKRRAMLKRKIEEIDAKMQPLHRQRAFYEGEIELIDQFEQAENEDAQATLGLTDAEIVGQQGDR